MGLMDNIKKAQEMAQQAAQGGANTATRPRETSSTRTWR